jgi:HAD superfamily hydrolase (TIGR01549 family)
MTIDTLFLDAGGVLVQPAWDRVAAALNAEGVDVSEQTLRAAEPLAKQDIDQAIVTGVVDDQSRGWAYFNRVLGRAGIPLSNATDAALQRMQEYHRAQNLWEELCPEVLPALEQFRSRGLKLVVVSNANGRLRHLLDRLDLTHWFDVVLDSHEWGVEKPDPRLFQLALDQSGAAASRTIHVGDLYHVDVVGARAAGLREGILLDAANLYGNIDCRRIRRLTEMTAMISTST